MTNCEFYQDELVSLLYEDEEASSSLKAHVQACEKCSELLKNYENIQQVFSSLPQKTPSSTLVEKVLAEHEKLLRKKWDLWTGFRHFFLHPAVVAAFVFMLTLGGTLFYKKYLNENKNETRISFQPLSEQVLAEEIAAFKHLHALHYLWDEEYEKAHQLLADLIEQDLNYSRWDEAVLQHIHVMKKMGRTHEAKRDVARLREYAHMSPDSISQVESEIE